MRLLELFAGTGSIGKVFRDKGWEVVSLDIDPKSEADIVQDIREWNYRVYPPGYFDVIWASPCCTHYSIARKRAKTPRDFVWADSLVLKTPGDNRVLFPSRLVSREPRNRFAQNPVVHDRVAFHRR